MIVAAIPVKRLSEAKSRLSPRLSPQERSALVLALLQRTVRALQESDRIDRVAIATPEAGLGERFEVESLPDEGSLNATLRGAAGWAREVRARALLIVPGDLPLLQATEVRHLVQAVVETPGIGIAPTHDGGTGALLLAPPDVIAPCFGPDSFAQHLELARRIGVPAYQTTAQGFAFDLDTLADLERLPSSVRSVISAGE